MLSLVNTTKTHLNLSRARIIAEQFLRAYHQTDREVSVAIIGAAAMRRLNKQYRGIDQATDVLSFSAETKTKTKTKNSFPYLGEILINPTALKKAGAYDELIGRQPLEAIFYFVLVHGLLHLLGWQDETEKERLKMVAEGKKFLAKVYRKFP